ALGTAVVAYIFHVRIDVEIRSRISQTWVVADGLSFARTGPVAERGQREAAGQRQSQSDPDETAVHEAFSIGRFSRAGEESLTSRSRLSSPVGDDTRHAGSRLGNRSNR